LDHQRSALAGRVDNLIRRIVLFDPSLRRIDAGRDVPFASTPLVPARMGG